MARSTLAPQPAMTSPRTTSLIASSLLLMALLAWSGMHPYDRTTWLLEIFPSSSPCPSSGPATGAFP